MKSGVRWERINSSKNKYMNEKKPKKFAITGGTGGGKSSLPPYLAEELLKYGIKPYLGREAATDLFSCGIVPAEVPITQQLIMQRMLSDEDILSKAAKSYTGPLIPCEILDRGIADCIPYSDTKTKEYEKNAALFDLTPHMIRERYDLVIHMVSTAIGAPDVFREIFGDNKVRVEGKDSEGNFDIERALQEAIIKDKQTQDAWLGSQKLKVIPNRASFEEKKREALKAILSALGLPIPQEIEHKFLVPKSFSRNDISVIHETVKLTQYYLNPTPQRQMMNYPQNAEKVIERIRIREHDGSRSFIYTLKAFVPGEKDPYELEDFMSEREFVQLVSFANSQPIKKDRTYFVYENQYFEFDQFEKSIDTDSNNILELEVTDKMTVPILPSFIPGLVDVTGNDYYRNENIAVRLVA